MRCGSWAPSAPMPLSGSGNDSVATAVLRFIKRNVGLLQQMARRDDLRRARGDAEGCSHLQLLARALHHEGYAFDNAAQALGNGGCDLRRGVGHDDDELLATIAAGEIGAANRGADAIGE